MSLFNQTIDLPGYGKVDFSIARELSRGNVALAKDLYAELEEGDPTTVFTAKLLTAVIGGAVVCTTLGPAILANMGTVGTISEASLQAYSIESLATPLATNGMSSTGLLAAELFGAAVPLAYLGSRVVSGKDVPSDVPSEENFNDYATWRARQGRFEGAVLERGHARGEADVVRFDPEAAGYPVLGGTGKFYNPAIDAQKFVMGESACWVGGHDKAGDLFGYEYIEEDGYYPDESKADLKTVLKNDPRLLETEEFSDMLSDLGANTAVGSGTVQMMIDLEGPETAQKRRQSKEVISGEKEEAYLDAVEVYEDRMYPEDLIQSTEGMIPEEVEQLKEELQGLKGTDTEKAAWLEELKAFKDITPEEVAALKEDATAATGWKFNADGEIEGLQGRLPEASDPYVDDPCTTYTLRMNPAPSEVLFHIDKIYDDQMEVEDDGNA